MSTYNIGFYVGIRKNIYLVFPLIWNYVILIFLQNADFKFAWYRAYFICVKIKLK